MIDNRNWKFQLAGISIGLIIGVILYIVFTIFLNHSGNEARNYSLAPPMQYDALTAEEISPNQQWMIPINKKQNEPIKVNLQASDLYSILGKNSWITPPINFKSRTGKLFLYIDYAGKEQYFSDKSRIYSIPVCIPLSKYSHCSINPASSYSSYNDKNFYYIEEFSNSRTIYELNDQKKDTKSLFYGYSLPHEYQITSSQDLAISFNSLIDEKTQMAWMRVSINDHPISLIKKSFFLTSKYQKFLKWFLILIPFIIFYDYQKNGGFSSPHALSIGTLLILWSGLNTVIWDINYMVIGCLLITFSGVMYIFANNLYKLSYSLGFFTILVFSYQYYGGFTHQVIKQIGLLTLIGTAIFIKTPD
ncbi:MAG: hypothetical protein EOO69_08555 [Moraxellaceae bacterium]|nr:MAG: hypothetical protein EOO69_08555 [Moraxellaceae bacterium]